MYSFIPHFQEQKKPEDSFDDPDRPLFGDDTSEPSENENEDVEDDDLVPYNLEDDESDLSPLKTPMYYLIFLVPYISSGT